MRSNDFYQKEVINIRTAKKLGYVSDIDINPSDGRVLNIIVPKHKLLFFRQEDYSIPWEDITLISDELILVEYGDNDVNCALCEE